mgnify:CR=1 FL=1
MKNVKGYKYIYDKNYTRESHDDYIAWAYKRIHEIDGELSIRWQHTMSPEYIEQLIEEEDYLKEEISAAYDSWMDHQYNL